MDIRNWNLVGIVTLALMVLLLGISGVFAYGNGHPDLSPMSSANVAFNFFGMIVCTVIFTSSLFDQRMSMGTLLFMCLLTIESLLLFWDLVNWIIDGNPEKIQIIKIINYYIYGLMLIIIITFWYYLRELYSSHSRQMKGLSRYVFLFFVIGMLLVVTNPFTELYFVVDPATGLYARTDTFALSVVAPLLMIVVEAYAIYRYESDRRNKAVLLTYLFIPFVATVIQVCAYGISLQYVSMALSLVIMYSNLYARRGSELIRNEVQMTEQRAAVMVSQIQPHFLYNALTSIMNIKGNPPETRDAIADFGKYMRSNLDSITQKAPIPFVKELDHVETYFNLRKLRFGDRLELTTDLKDRNFMVPSQCVKLVVAAIIEFNLVRRDTPVSIHISSELVDGEHQVRIRDSGSPENSSEFFRSEGLHQLRYNGDRLSSMVSGTIENLVDDGGHRVTLMRIPVKKGGSR